MKLAIFDFDGTIFMKETLPFLLDQWQKQNLPKSKLIKTYLGIIHLYLIYKLKLHFIMPAETVRVKSFKKLSRIFKGMSVYEIISFIKSCSKDASHYFNQDVLKEIEKANDQGYHTVILSGCYEMMLEYVAEQLNVKTVIGTKLHFDENNIIDFSQPLKVSSGEQKAISIHEHFKTQKIDWENSFAYADSAHDIHIFNTVGNPVAVNPDDKLKEIAQKDGWRIIA